MIRGLYTAASGMLANERMQEVISNNLANADTPGFKADDGELLAFPQQLIARMSYGNSGNAEQGTPKTIGALGTGVWFQSIDPRFTPGTLQKTGQLYDFAIQDPSGQALQTGQASQPGQTQQTEPMSFFAVYDPSVSNPNGTAGGTIFTRDGHFQKDSNNMLETVQGQRVLAVDNTGNVIPNSGIQIQPDGTMQAFTVDKTGAPVQQITDTNGSSITDLRAVAVANPNQMIPYGNNGFSYTGTTQQSNAAIRQGYMEGSNVDPSQSMVSMINVMRSYEANSKVIHTLDQTMQHAANDIGRVG